MSFFESQDFDVFENVDEPLMELVESYFPTESRENISPNNVKEIITSDEFKSSVSGYFVSLDEKN